MSDLFTYRLIHFMPMSPEVYLRLFERANAAYWPAPLFSFLLGFTILWLAFNNKERFCLSFLGIVWIWQAYSFHLAIFSEINWAANYLATGFFIQGLLFFLAALFKKSHLFTNSSYQVNRSEKLTLLALNIGTLIFYPLLSFFINNKLSSAHYFMFAPQPTLIFTILLLTIFAARSWWLYIAPVFFLVLYVLIDFAMDWYVGLVNLFVFLIWFVYLVFRRVNGVEPQ